MSEGHKKEIGLSKTHTYYSTAHLGQRSRREGLPKAMPLNESQTACLRSYNRAAGE